MARSRYCRICSDFHALDMAWPEACLGHFGSVSDGAGPYIQSDTMDPIRSMADGRMYDSKSRYRADIRARGLIEVGNEPPSLRETLEAAASGDEGTPEAPAPVETAAPVEAAPSIDGDTQEPAEAGARPRGQDGKFIPKAADGAPAPAAAPAPIPETVELAPPEPEQPAQATRVPPSLPAALKAKFSTLEPDVQQAFVKLEESVQTAKAEWGKKAERLNRFDEILAPRREKLAYQGVDEIQAVQMLFAAQDILDRDPLQGLAYIARSYGVDLRQIAQQMSGDGLGQGGQPAPTQGGLDVAALRPLLSEIVTPLQEQLAALQQNTEAEKFASAQSVVDEFAIRPENMYFEDVRQDIAAYLRSGQATTLQAAYDMPDHPSSPPRLSGPGAAERDGRGGQEETGRGYCSREVAGRPERSGVRHRITRRRRPGSRLEVHRKIARGPEGGLEPPRRRLSAQRPREGQEQSPWPLPA